MFKNKMVAGLVMVCLALGAGVGLQGCIQQSDTGTSVVVPNVNIVSQNAKSFAQLADAFYLNDDDAAAIANMVDYICDQLESGQHDCSKLILNTLEESINNDVVPEYTRYLVVGLLDIMNHFFEVKEYNVDDALSVLRGFSSGLKSSGISAQSIQLNF